MAKKALPKCFISYCHDDADFNTIEAFHAEIKRLAKGSFDILRDKSNVGAGDKITIHEQEIDSSDVIFILCTPQYKSKITNRTLSGVYHEYNLILEKYHRYTATLKGGGTPRAFALIPILFSGTHDTAIMDDVMDNLYLDFTRFRAVKGKNGRPIIAEYAKQTHVHEFEKIRSKLAAVRSGIEHSFERDYNLWLELLFLEAKHEVLRKKYKFNNVEEMLNDLFVETKSYDRISSGDKCILIGRKGSGKSTIVDHYHRGNSFDYKPPIIIIVDNFDLGFLYNYIFTKAHSQDIREVIRVEVFFETVWRIYILLQCAYTLVDEEASGTNTVDLSPDIDVLNRLSSGRQETRWGQFVDTCSQVQAYIDSVIKDAPAGAEFYSKIVSKLSIDTIVEQVMGKPAVKSLKACIKKCSRKFIFSLDGFDQRFEDFRTANLSMANSDEEISRRIQFEISWLKGLLRTVVEYRSSDEVVQESIAFCVTIPQDRFLEARSTERDDYRFRALSANLQWSAIELSILIRKRLEGLTQRNSNENLPPIDSLAEILQSEDLEFPQKIEMRVGGNVLAMSFFKYILRHTFWRPRDVMFYIAAILANKKYARKHRKAIDHSLVKEIVSRTTYDVIDTEFLKEYQSSITNMRGIIEGFEGQRLILNFDELNAILSRVPFNLSGGLVRLDGIFEKIDLLYEIGFIGMEIPPRQIRSAADCRDMFVFSDGIRRYASIGADGKKKSNFVIHPIFSALRCFKWVA